MKKITKRMAIGLSALILFAGCLVIMVTSRLVHIPGDQIVESAADNGSEKESLYLEGNTVGEMAEKASSEMISGEGDSETADSTSGNNGADRSETKISRENESDTNETAAADGSEEMESQKEEVSTEDQKTLIIEIDPGHGGIQSGAEYKGTLEKDINLKIAQYLKTELEEYENVSAYLTHGEDEKVELEDRVKKAAEDEADVLISIHANAYGDCAAYDHGSTVLVPRGAYESKLSLTGQELGCYILYALSELGLENQGLMFRVAQNGKTYPNGELLDYYSIIRNSVLSGIPGIIIEHGFMDHAEEYENYFSTDEKLKKLARADARGIAAYYGLKKDGKAEDISLKDHEETVTLITTDFSEDNEVFKKKYFHVDKD